MNLPEQTLTDIAKRTDLIGFIAKVFQADCDYRAGKTVAINHLEAAVPANATTWWKENDYRERLKSLLAKDTAGSPIDLLPFNYA